MTVSWLGRGALVAGLVLACGFAPAAGAAPGSPPTIRATVVLSGGMRYRRTITRPERSSDRCALLWLRQSHRLLLDVGYNIAALHAAFQGTATADLLHVTVAPFNLHAVGTIVPVAAQVTVVARHRLFVSTRLSITVRYGGLQGTVRAPHLAEPFNGGRPATLQVEWSCTRLQRIGLPSHRL